MTLRHLKSCYKDWILCELMFSLTILSSCYSSLYVCLCVFFPNKFLDLLSHSNLLFLLTLLWLHILILLPLSCKYYSIYVLRISQIIQRYFSTSTSLIVCAKSFLICTYYRKVSRMNAWGHFLVYWIKLK